MRQMAAACGRCGSDLVGRFCPGCGSEGGQKHGVPALLSFLIPGLGQMVKGHVLSGLLIMAGMVASLLAIAVVVGVIATPVLWIWQTYDAYTRNG